MQLDNIIMKQEGHVSIVTINHPPANAWNLAAMLDFERVIDAVEKDKNVRVVIITGAGERFFSSGYDVTDHANAEKISPKGRELWRRLDRFSKPLIAAINGHAMGGGCELALACHFRIMADNPPAKIGLTELNLGIMPAWGGTQRMTLLLGRSRALDLILFSKRLTPQEALDIGLVDRTVPPEKLMDEALDLARRLAERPPIAVGCVLKAMAAGMYEGLDAGLKVEGEGSQLLRTTQDAREGFTAFLEKRPPVFKGE
ncbi:MAG: enoyl-CoA hydratase-related protein [Pseudomonadota bacterium]